MKIGLVLSQPPSYSETFFNSKIKGLIDSGFEVILFVQKNTNNYKDCKVITAPKIYKNIGLQGLQSLWVLMTLMPYVIKTRRFLRLEKQSGRTVKQQFKNLLTNAHILKANLDWVHFGFTTIALKSENVAQAIGAKMAVSCRGYDMDVFPLKHDNPYRLIWKSVDKVHVISNYMKAKAMESGMKATTPVDIITPAIDLSKFEIISQVTKDEILQITTIARLHWIKALLPTLEALVILKREGVKFQYQIIGSGPQFEELTFAIYQLDLMDEVRLMGQQNHKAIIARLAQTDIYLQYSHSEGFCNAVLEAQAMGCLTVVSDGGALPENIVHNTTGIVVPKNDHSLLAATLKEIKYWDENKKTIFRINAKNRLEQKFGIENQAKEFKRFYNVI